MGLELYFLEFHIGWSYSYVDGSGRSRFGVLGKVGYEGQDDEDRDADCGRDGCDSRSVFFTGRAVRSAVLGLDDNGGSVTDGVGCGERALIGNRFLFRFPG